MKEAWGALQGTVVLTLAVQGSLLSCTGAGRLKHGKRPGPSSGSSGLRHGDRLAYHRASTGLSSFQFPGRPLR